MEKEPSRKPNVSLGGIKKMLTAFEMPKSENRKLIAILAGVTVVAVVEGIALAGMAPLKERIPYFVEVEQATGRVEVAERAGRKFVADSRVRQYFLARWVEDYKSIDELSRQHRLPRSYGVVRGIAVKQWDQGYKDEAPMQKLSEKPEFRREIHIASYVELSDDTVQIRFLQRDLPDGKEKRRMATIKYASLPPKNDEEIYSNPAGLWITEFQFSDEQI